MNRRVMNAGEVKMKSRSRSESESEEGGKVSIDRPETGGSRREQGEVEVKLDGGPNRPPLKRWRMICV